MKTILIFLLFLFLSCASKDSVELGITGNTDQLERHFIYTKNKVYEFQNNFLIKKERFKANTESMNIEIVLQSANNFMNRINYNNGKYELSSISLQSLDKKGQYWYYSINFIKSDLDPIKGDFSLLEDFFEVLVYPNGQILPIVIHDKKEFLEKAKSNQH